MRLLAPLMLVGLLAVTAHPVAALCADDGNGGCQGFRHDLTLDVRSDCEDSAGGLCLAAPDDVDAYLVPSGGILNLTIRNLSGVVLDFEVFATARFDDAQSDDGSQSRLRADLLHRFDDLQPGEVRTQEIALDGNVSKLRLQALSVDQRHAEIDADVTPVMLMTGMPEVDPAQDDVPADSQKDAGKDAPYLGIVAIVGVLAAIVGLRRYD